MCWLLRIFFRLKLRGGPLWMCWFVFGCSILHCFDDRLTHGQYYLIIDRQRLRLCYRSDGFGCLESIIICLFDQKGVGYANSWWPCWNLWFVLKRGVSYCYLPLHQSEMKECVLLGFKRIVIRPWISSPYFRFYSAARSTLRIVSARRLLLVMKVRNCTLEYGAACSIAKVGSAVMKVWILVVKMLVTVHGCSG